MLFKIINGLLAVDIRLDQYIPVIPASTRTRGEHIIPTCSDRPQHQVTTARTVTSPGMYIIGTPFKPQADTPSGTLQSEVSTSHSRSVLDRMNAS